VKGYVDESGIGTHDLQEQQFYAVPDGKTLIWRLKLSAISSSNQVHSTRNATVQSYLWARWQSIEPIARPSAD
jgi:hypothetical protein